MFPSTERKQNIYLRNKMSLDPDVIRTRSLLIWSQTRYRCATESDIKMIIFLSIYQILTILTYSFCSFPLTYRS